MKFEFALESLLKHKKTLEDLARKEWAEAQGQVDEANNKLKDMFNQIDDARTRTSRIEKAGGQKAGDLVSIDEFIVGQGLRIEKHRELIRDLMIEAERRHALLVEAAKETKTLEKLRERQFEEYRLRRKKQDAKKMDEIIVTRFGSEKMGISLKIQETNEKNNEKNEIKRFNHDEIDRK
jgi:flagellar FliJ protein